MTGKTSAGSGDQFGNLFDSLRVDTGFVGSELEGVSGVELSQFAFEFRKRRFRVPSFEFRDAFRAWNLKLRTGFLRSLFRGT